MTDEPKTDTPGDPAPPPTRLRIRWGWFLLCIVLGFAAITVGWLLVSSDNRLSYVSGVFGNVGTTLLLVGIVVLLERRIVDTAVKIVRNAAEEARVRTNEEVRAQVRDLEDRLADVWKTANPEDAAEQTRRMTDEFTKRVVDEYSGEDEPRHAAP